MLVDRQLKPGLRVTVRMDGGYDKAKGKTYLLGRAVAPSRPREEEGTYWGYITRLAPSLQAVFSSSSFEGGCDSEQREVSWVLALILFHELCINLFLVLQTVRRLHRYDYKVGVTGNARAMDVHDRKMKLPPFKHLIVVVGGHGGIEDTVENDSELGLSGKVEGDKGILILKKRLDLSSLFAVSHCRLTALGRVRCPGPVFYVARTRPSCSTPLCGCCRWAVVARSVPTRRCPRPSPASVRSSTRPTHQRKPPRRPHRARHRARRRWLQAYLKKSSAAQGSHAADWLQLQCGRRVKSLYEHRRAERWTALLFLRTLKPKETAATVRIINSEVPPSSPLLRISTSGHMLGRMCAAELFQGPVVLTFLIARDGFDLESFETVGLTVTVLEGARAFGVCVCACLIAFFYAATYVIKK